MVFDLAIPPFRITFTRLGEHDVIHAFREVELFDSKFNPAREILATLKELVKIPCVDGWNGFISYFAACTLRSVRSCQHQLSRAFGENLSGGVKQDLRGFNAVWTDLQLNVKDAV